MRVLILGGTDEGFRLADRLAEIAGIDFVSSLAGRTQNPRMPKGTVRVGGFGGAEGLALYLRDEGISHLVNATHPFAAQISANAVTAADSAGVPLIRLLRPAWAAEADDRWIGARDANEAAALCIQHGGRIFLTLGAQEMDAFANVHNAHFLVRVVDAPKETRLRDYRIITARGPFSLHDELRLLGDHHISLIVTKNSGGPATYAKIEAARRLSLPVIMIDRPAIALDPRSAVATGVDEVIAWLQHQAASIRETDRTSDSSSTRGDSA
jgi:precorrin-6A/cobalt-precorrin-6A reductase